MSTKPNGSKRIVKSHGRPYVWIKVEDKWMTEHRYVMEQYIGRKLEVNEHVHHINENTCDNRIENLEIIDPISHTRHHKPERYERKPKTECQWCGKYIAYSEHKKYCSPKCRFQATHVTRICEMCGERFIAYRKSTLITCETCRSKKRKKNN